MHYFVFFFLIPRMIWAVLKAIFPLQPLKGPAPSPKPQPWPKAPQRVPLSPAPVDRPKRRLTERERILASHAEDVAAFNAKHGYEALEAES